MFGEIQSVFLAHSTTRDRIMYALRRIDPVAVLYRRLGSKKRTRVSLTADGPHHQWSIDGHDKLTKLGMPIYGIRDKWTGYLISLEIVPNNRRSATVAQLYLNCVLEYGGIPRTITSDKGSEIGRVFDLQSTFR